MIVLPWSEGQRPDRTGRIMFFDIMHMRYLIKLEDRSNGREAFVECPADMVLEDLNYKIKVELHLPYTDHFYHVFQMHGKVYVPYESVARDLWHVDEWATGVDYIQQVRNYPRERDICNSNNYRLNQVYTVLGSAITYIQQGGNQWDKVRCTLVARFR